ncbi:hypothetical protein Y032_0041g372 [Ancylostoma ceylanicum]|uniref:Serpin domain-containing protein n=1 Tax=Ancylostoma ceylanicum TaxID=53326 RepID=A0A016UGW9_9BILA|nr:hypothetical protein Y032_0041g372 [Ancylostoma ceylanicum]
MRTPNSTLLATETNFGLNMIRHSPATHSCVVSPISVMFALAMVQIGSKGKTKMQINEVISKGEPGAHIITYYSKLSHEIGEANNGVKTRIANAFFIDGKFKIKDDYRDRIRGKFSAKVATLNFSHTQESAETINNFVSGATGGKIKNFIRASSLRAASSLLVNAIYFMAEWQHKFSKKLSYKAKFFYAEGKTRQVDFMNDVQVRRAYAENDDMQVLSLPYTDSAYAMNIFLPKKRYGLEELLAKIDGATIQSMLSQLKKTLVSITIPKMKLETDSNLKAALIAVGVTELFSTSADLSGVSDASIAVSAATHKAVIEMDEESTSAAAATAFRFSYKSFSKNLRRFIANHPFLFIVTKSGHPLFMGKFANE